MLQRGASFSSTICSGFCKLDALFVSDSSHAFRAAGRQRHLFQTTARRDPPRPLTTNHTAFDDVVNPPARGVPPLAARAAATLSRRRRGTIKRLREEKEEGQTGPGG